MYGLGVIQASVWGEQGWLAKTMWLKSKLAPPQPPAHAVPRPRLHALLDRWARYRVILVRAAAGYGKTSLVSIWATQSNAPTIAWLSLDPAESDPVQFVRYVAAALDRVLPGALAAIDPILRDTQPDATHAMTALLTFLGERDDAPLLLVLDDYHRADSAEVNDLVNLALERAPAWLHFLLITRDVPALPLARLMVNGLLLELTNEDLRFNRDEVTHFLQSMDQPPIPDAQLMTIMQRSEGWVAALKMASLSMADETDPERYLEKLSGANQWQADYLTGEVLNHQSPELRQFLLQTSILNRLNPHLCEVVTGRRDAASLLAAAHGAGLFLVALDERRTWYRYHHLFQEMLQLRLAESYSTAAVCELHERAAAQFAADGAGDEAVAHYLAAGNTDAAAALLEQLIRAAMNRKELHEAEVLLSRLPDDEMERRPRLLILVARLNLLRSDPALIGSTARAEEAFARISVDDAARPRLEAELLICQAGVALIQRRMDALEAFLRRADALEPLLDDLFRAILLYIRFNLAMHQGLWNEADDYARQAVIASLRADDVGMVISMRREMAMRLLYLGRAAEAARELEEVIATYPLPQPNFVLRDLVYTFVTAAEVNYWLNNLERMGELVREIEQIGDQTGDEVALMLSYQLLDLWQLANSAAAPQSHHPRPLGAQARGAVRFNTEYEIIYQIRSGQLGNASLLLELLGITPTSDPETVPPARLPMYALGAVATATVGGRDLKALDGLMSGGLMRLGRMKFLHFLGRLQAIEAWRQVKLGNRNAATKALAAAVETTAQTGVVRAILDIPDLGPLLAEIDHPRAMTLAAMMEVSGAAALYGPASLTPSEARVLTLLSHDLRYSDIARELSISIHTVRSHVLNIYRKLGVNRRLAAIEVARQAGVIE